MLPLRRPVLACLLAAGTATALTACGKDDPLGNRDAGNSPKPVSNDTTTAELTATAIKRGLPSVVAVSVTRGGVTRTGTGTVLAKGLVVTDASLVGATTVTTVTKASAPTPTPTTSPTAQAASTTPAGTSPSATTPKTATPTPTPAGTSPQSTTPTRTPSPTPKAKTTTTLKVQSAGSVSVREADGEEHPATVEGLDALSGLAALRVDELDAVPPARAGSAPVLGEQVASLGYLAARRPAVRPASIVTAGRAAHRNNLAEVGLFEASGTLGMQGVGGPVVDARGQVVGITTRVIPSLVPGTVVALPYASALRIGKALESDGQVRRAYLGLETVGITPTRAEELQLSTASGVLIRRIVPGSPAAFSTLKGPSGYTQIAGRVIPKGSDAITQVDGATIKEPEDLDAALAKMRPGHKVALRVIRDTHSLVVHVTLTER